MDMPRGQGMHHAPGMASHGYGMMPHGNGVTPQEQGMVSQEHGVMPQAQGREVTYPAPTTVRPNGYSQYDGRGDQMV